MTIGYRQVYYDYQPAQGKVGGTRLVFTGGRYRVLNFKAENSSPKVGLKCIPRIRETL